MTAFEPKISTETKSTVLKNNITNNNEECAILNIY